MAFNILNSFNVTNSKMLLGVTLSVVTFLSFASVQENLRTNTITLSDTEVTATLQNPQNQNDVELIMSIMKIIEDKNIEGISKKINFVDTFKVSDYIKNTIKSYIRQNINYSDNERISYGIYRSKKCNHQQDIINTDQVLYDFIKSGGGCFSHPLFSCTPSQIQ